MEKNKSRKLNLIMNEVVQDSNDPTKVNFSMVILDNTLSGNNVIVDDIALESLAKSVKGMPLVARLVEDEYDRSNDDFGDHEARMGKNRHENDVIIRDTIAVGSFTSDGYIVEEEVDGINRKLLKGDGVLWATRYSDIVELIYTMNENGIKINTSSEYLYGEDNVSFNEDGQEVHSGEIYFEGIAVLGSDSNYVAPAYESATFTMLNDTQKNEFKLLVAQALEKENNKNSSDSEEEQELNVMANEVNEELELIKVQLNELSEGKKELEVKLNELTESKGQLARQLNDANDVISQLNKQVEDLTALNSELSPFKEQVEAANKQAKVSEITESFEAKFNSVDGIEAFKSEEVQALLLNAIEEGEVGLNAKLALNEKVLELASVKLEKSKNPMENMLNSVKTRDFTNLVQTKDEDILSDLY